MIIYKKKYVILNNLQKFIIKIITYINLVFIINLKIIYKTF